LQMTLPCPCQDTLHLMLQVLRCLRVDEPHLRVDLGECAGRRQAAGRLEVT